MGRYQAGTVYEASGSFFVRYYVGYSEIDGERRAEIAQRCEADGKPLPSRVLVSHRLCAKDDRHHSVTCKPVRKLAAEHMAQVNEQTTPTSYITVAEFWEKTYLPFIEEHKRHSTLLGYKQIWSKWLKDHFGTTPMKDYRTPQATVFITALAKTLGRRTVSNIRSLASAIFSHAVAIGTIESNPWHDAKVLGKIIEPAETGHYTLEEAEDIISALVQHVDVQLMFSLGFFAGLRTSEIQGLKWEDFDSVPNFQGVRCVHIRRGVVRNRVAATKTKDSTAPLPLIKPVLKPLQSWWTRCGRPSTGWCFPNAKGKPRDMRTVVNGKILPALKVAGLEWKGFYCGRRGGATVLADLTKAPAASKELLRHTTSTVTETFYVKGLPESLLQGMRLLESASAARRAEVKALPAGEPVTVEAVVIETDE